VDVFHAIEAYGWRIFCAGMACLAVETLLPASRCSLISRLRAAGFWLVYIVITVSAFSVFNACMASAGIRPLLKLDLSRMSDFALLPLQIAGCIGAFGAAALVADFFYYWFHRLQHANPLLWRFHAVHHSLREMSGWNCYHHFTEEIFRIPFVILPITLLINVTPGTAPVVIIPALFAIHGFCVHSCTRLHWGWFRYVVVDNRYHRIHHSTERRHLDRNFAAFASIWDLLFRTAHFPLPHEWPPVGVADIDEPKRLAEFLWRPFRPQTQAEARLRTRRQVQT
jgi:sterol desaturase/sphingolipid hydroxylase (fatty acid hydroxylase superfamily)